MDVSDCKEEWLLERGNEPVVIRSRVSRGKSRMII